MLERLEKEAPKNSRNILLYIYKKIALVAETVRTQQGNWWSPQI